MSSAVRGVLLPFSDQSLVCHEYIPINITVEFIFSRTFSCKEISLTVSFSKFNLMKMLESICIRGGGHI